MGLINDLHVNILPGSRMRGAKRIVTRRPAPAGISGVEIERGAYDVPVSVYRTAATCASRADALDLVAAYEALIGEDVTVTDEDGTTYPAVTVLGVECGDPEPRLIIIGADTDGDTWDVQATWAFQGAYSPTRPGAL
jgi:hypothetical protein